MKFINHTTTARPSTDGRPERHRARWAAIGAAVAVSLGAGGISLANAAVEEGDKPVYISLDEPCRLIDSRPGQVGDFNDPIGPGTTWDITAHGVNGDCDIPTDALAISANITGLNATATTFFTLFAEGQELPLVSNLNVEPGQPPTPNLANVNLSAAGEFSLYNAFGTADAIIDIAGYYVDHNHDDRYSTRSAGDEYDDGGAAVLTVIPGPGPQPPLPLMTLPVDTPLAGQIIVNSSARVIAGVPGQFVTCSINNVPGLIDPAVEQVFESAGNPGDTANLAGTRTFDVDGTADVTLVYLNCQAAPTPGTPPLAVPSPIVVSDVAVSAVFVPEV